MMDLLRLNITKEAQLDLVTVSKVFVRDSEYWQTISNKAKTLQKRLARLAVDFEKEKQFLKEALVFARQDDFRKAKEIETSISGRYPNLGAEELRGLIQKSEHRANHVRDEFRAFLRENNPRCPIPEDRTRNFTDYDKYSSYIAGKLMNPFNVGITRYSWSRRIDEFVAEVKEDEAVARKLPESEMRDTLVSSCGQVLKEVAKLREAIDRALRRRRVNASLAILSLVAIFIVGGFFVTAKLLIPHTGFVVDGRGTIFESIELLRPDGTLIDTEEYKVVSNQKRFEIRDLLPGSYVLRFKEDGVYPYYLPVSAMIGTLTDITNDLLKVISVSDEAALSVNMIAGSKLVIKDSVNGWESLLKSKLVEIPSVSSVQSCVFNPVTNNLIIGYLNGGIKIYDINRKLVLREYSEHKDSVEALAIDSTGRYLLSASIDRSMKLWDLKRDVLLRNMEGHGGAVHDIVFKPGEMIVASGCADGMIRLWDISKGELIRVLETTAKDDLAGRNWSITPKLEDVKFSVNKEFLSLLSSQGEHSLMHSNNVYDLEFTKDGSTLIAGRANGTIDIWNLYGDNQMQEELKALKMELEKIQKTKQSIEKESIVDESALGILEEDVLDMVSELKQKVKTAELVAQNEGNDPELELISKIRNLETKIESIQKHIVVHGHKSPVYAIAISDDARYIFSAGADGTIKMWDYNNSELLQNFIGHAATITSLLYVDGKVVSGSSDGEYVIWDAKRSEVLEKTKAHENSIQDMALSPNGKFFVSGSLDTNVRIWNFQNQFKIPMPVGSFTVRVSKDGFQDFEQDFELKKGQLLELKTVLLKN
jgi:WD40 repeat protein